MSSNPLPTPTLHLPSNPHCEFIRVGVIAFVYPVSLAVSTNTLPNSQLHTLVDIVLSNTKTITYTLKSEDEAQSLYKTLWNIIQHTYPTVEVHYRQGSFKPFTSSQIPIKAIHLKESFKLQGDKLEIGNFNPQTFNNPTVNEFDDSTRLTPTSSFTLFDIPSFTL